METVLVCLASFFAAGVTLFSGFGLGTVLMPVIAIFFPIPVAVALTAVVHLLNSLFKLVLLWRAVDRRVVLFFGVPALFAAIPGALLLDYLTFLQPLAGYDLNDKHFTITPVKLAAGLLLLIFATAELIPIFERAGKHRLGLPLGGALSGFFGGLSGNQGAFRGAFLVRAGLTKEAFIASNAAIAALVDASRLLIYGLTFERSLIAGQGTLIAWATLGAFLGVFLGTRLLAKVTIVFVQRLVALVLYLIGSLLCLGIV